MHSPTPVYLKPGELSINDRPAIVSTVLGSCVAITLFNRRLGQGAICHAMLPYGGGREDFRYLDHSLRFMLQRFAGQGIGRPEIEVKLFGGADMFPTSSTARTLTVGKQNIEAALSLLGQEHLQVRASCIGGSQGRKLHFYSHTGEVLIKRLGSGLLS